VGNADDGSIDEETAGYLRGLLPREMGLKGDDTEKRGELKAQMEWTGIMGFSRDDLPFVGPVPGHDGVYISAGYTGHGMPNAWLCGKAVASMVEQDLAGAKQDEAVESAVRSVGLPRAYLSSEERLKLARERPTVAQTDHMTGFKAAELE